MGTRFKYAFTEKIIIFLTDNRCVYAFNQYIALASNKVEIQFKNGRCQFYILLFSKIKLIYEKKDTTREDTGPRNGKAISTKPQLGYDVNIFL